MTGTMSGVQQGLVMHATPSMSVPRIFRRSSLLFLESFLDCLIVTAVGLLFINNLVSSIENGLSKSTDDLAWEAQLQTDCPSICTLHDCLVLSLAQQASSLVSSCILHTPQRLI